VTRQPAHGKSAARPSAARIGGLGALVIALATLGCASAQGRGEQALRAGRNAVAADAFGQALAQDPTRIDALVGLGVARYRLEAYDTAVEPLARAVADAPRHPAARLYLGLAQLQRGDARAAAEHLAAFRDLGPDDRLVAQLDRTLAILRGPALSPEVRAFIAASLEDEAALVREVREARRLLRRPQPPPVHGGGGRMR
jgi:tetratricopeptide (TPR) repeat protein